MMVAFQLDITASKTDDRERSGRAEGVSTSQSIRLGASSIGKGVAADEGRHGFVYNDYLLRSLPSSRP